jgi:hypothetical protein
MGPVKVHNGGFTDEVSRGVISGKELEVDRAVHGRP